MSYFCLLLFWWLTQGYSPWFPNFYICGCVFMRFHTYFIKVKFVVCTLTVFLMFSFLEHWCREKKVIICVSWSLTIMYRTHEGKVHFILGKAVGRGRSGPKRTAADRSGPQRTAADRSGARRLACSGTLEILVRKLQRLSPHSRSGPKTWF